MAWRVRPCGHLDVSLPASRPARIIFYSYKLSGLFCFVTASLGNEYGSLCDFQRISIQNILRNPTNQQEKDKPPSRKWTKYMNWEITNIKGKQLTFLSHQRYKKKKNCNKISSSLLNGKILGSWPPLNVCKDVWKLDTNSAGERVTRFPVAVITS